MVQLLRRVVAPPRSRRSRLVVLALASVLLVSACVIATVVADESAVLDDVPEVPQADAVPAGGEQDAAPVPVPDAASADAGTGDSTVLSAGEFDDNPDTPPVLSEWTTEHVAMWLADNKFPVEVIDIFKANHIDGELLTSISTDDATLKELGVSSINRKRLAIRISKLQAVIHSDPTSSDFWDFRAANRKLVHVGGSWLMGTPRTTILYWYLFDYEAKLAPVFSSDGTSWRFWCAWLFAPQTMLGYYAWQFMDTNPIFISIFEIVCVANFVNEISMILGKGQSSYGNSMVASVLFNLVYSLIWPIIPWFLVDILFFLSLFFTALGGFIIILGVIGFVVAIAFGARRQQQQPQQPRPPQAQEQEQEPEPEQEPGQEPGQDQDQDQEDDLPQEQDQHLD